METLLRNAYTPLDQKSKLFKTNSIATGTKNYSKQKQLFQLFTKWHFEKYKMKIFVVLKISPNR